MDTGLVVHGAVLGFAIAAPVGPIGLLVIERTLHHGRRHGLATGLGAASADGVYGALAALGLTAVTGWLASSAGWLRLGGGLVLIYLGVATMVAKTAEGAAPEGKFGATGAYLSAVLLTLTNPATIISFLAIFATLGVAAGKEPAGALAIVMGVFLGSLAWWVILVAAVTALAARMPATLVRWIRLGGGLLLVGYGLAALGSAAWVTSDGAPGPVLDRRRGDLAPPPTTAYGSPLTAVHSHSIVAGGLELTS